MRLVPARVLAVLAVPMSLALTPAAIAAEPERRDPFASLLDADSDPDPEPRTALEKVTIEQLVLSGIVVGTATPKAMFTTPDGRGHFARVGDGVGKNRARIVRISARGVTLVDAYRDALGAVHKDVIELQAPAAKRTL